MSFLRPKYRIYIVSYWEKNPHIVSISYRVEKKLTAQGWTRVSKVLRTNIFTEESFMSFSGIKAFQPSDLKKWFMKTFYTFSLHSSFLWCSPLRGCSGDAGSVASVLKWPTKEVFGALPARIPLIPFLSVDILPSSPCTKLDDRTKEKKYLTKKQSQAQTVWWCWG